MYLLAWKRQLLCMFHVESFLWQLDTSVCRVCFRDWRKRPSQILAAETRSGRNRSWACTPTGKWVAVAAVVFILRYEFSMQNFPFTWPTSTLQQQQMLTVSARCLCSETRLTELQERACHDMSASTEKQVCRPRHFRTRPHPLACPRTTPLPPNPALLRYHHCIFVYITDSTERLLWSAQAVILT